MQAILCLQGPPGMSPPPPLACCHALWPPPPARSSSGVWKFCADMRLRVAVAAVMVFCFCWAVAGRDSMGVSQGMRQVPDS